MARALKVFSTPAGFFTAVVAAPSQKAALEAWGVRDNLFATGAAVVVTDPDLVAAALARPGEIVRAPLPQDSPTVSSAERKPTPSPPPPAPRPPPDRTALTWAEAALEGETRRRTEALAAIKAERAALDAREARVHAEATNACARPKSRCRRRATSMTAQHRLGELAPTRKDATVFTTSRERYVPLNIRSEQVNALAETLAARQHVTKTDAVKQALENELRRLDQALPLRERLRPLQDRVMARPPTGLEADKTFYDDLSEEP